MARPNLSAAAPPGPAVSRAPAAAPDSDAALLARYARGDRAAAQALVGLHLPRVLGFARRMLGDAAEAEDVAQEAMLRLWRIAPDWRPGEARISTWLYRVTANLCTDRLRRRRPAGLDAAAEAAEDPARGPEAVLIAADRTAALEAALARLPERQRQAVVLRHVEGLGNAEIAAVMGIGIEAVESLTARGKRGLALLLAGQGRGQGDDDDRF